MCHSLAACFFVRGPYWFYSSSGVALFTHALVHTTHICVWHIAHNLSDDFAHPVQSLVKRNISVKVQAGLTTLAPVSWLCRLPTLIYDTDPFAAIAAGSITHTLTDTHLSLTSCENLFYKWCHWFPGSTLTSLAKNSCPVVLKRLMLLFDNRNNLQHVWGGQSVITNYSYQKQ